MKKFFKIIFLQIIFTFNILIMANCTQSGIPDGTECQGEPGRCTINFDGERGGFVAHSAIVEARNYGKNDGKKIYYPSYRNVPYLEPTVQICKKAQVLGYSDILKFAVITDRAIVGERANKIQRIKITDHAYISEDAQIRQFAQISEYARIGGSSIIGHGTKVLGNVSIYNNRLINDSKYHEFTLFNDISNPIYQNPTVKLGRGYNIWHDKTILLKYQNLLLYGNRSLAREFIDKYISNSKIVSNILILTIQNGNSETLNYLLNKINFTDPHINWTQIVLIASYKNSEIFSSIVDYLKNKSNDEYSLLNGETFFTLLASIKSYIPHQNWKVLIDRNYDINKINRSSGKTPLEVAINSENIAHIIEILINDADYNLDEMENLILSIKNPTIELQELYKLLKRIHKSRKINSFKLIENDFEQLYTNKFEINNIKRLKDLIQIFHFDLIRNKKLRYHSYDQSKAILPGPLTTRSVNGPSRIPLT